MRERERYTRCLSMAQCKHRTDCITDILQHMIYMSSIKPTPLYIHCRSSWTGKTRATDCQICIQLLCELRVTGWHGGRSQHCRLWQGRLSCAVLTAGNCRGGPSFPPPILQRGAGCSVCPLCQSPVTLARGESSGGEPMGKQPIRWWNYRGSDARQRDGNQSGCSISTM